MCCIYYVYVYVVYMYVVCIAVAKQKLGKYLFELFSINIQLKLGILVYAVFGFKM